MRVAEVEILRRCAPQNDTNGAPKTQWIVTLKDSGLGGPSLQRWGTRFTPNSVFPTTKVMGHSVRPILIFKCDKAIGHYKRINYCV